MTLSKTFLGTQKILRSVLRFTLTCSARSLGRYIILTQKAFCILYVTRSQRSFCIPCLILVLLTAILFAGSLSNLPLFSVYKWEKKVLLKTNSPQAVVKLTRNPMRSLSARRSWADFLTFAKKYNKTYSDGPEKAKRFLIYQTNMKIAHKLQQTEQGTAKYGASPFADLSVEEFKKYLLTPEWYDTGYPSEYAKIPDVDLPKSWDWRDHGAVTEVKNQGFCGSCWAFSVTGNIEGQWAIKKKRLVSLSEQELVDCDKLDDGCSGGLPGNAYKEIMRLGGLESESDYPYDGHNDKCQFHQDETEAFINGSVKVSKNETEMAKFLYKNGPLTIGINAFAMMFYLGGVSHPFNFMCSPAVLNHGVLIVGFGEEKSWFGNDLPYWIIKNSWGKFWGYHGYYYVYRGDGTCGLNMDVSSATVK